MNVRGKHLRGALGGAALGLSLGILLTIYRVLRFGSFVPAVLLLVCIAFGIAWSFVAPTPRLRHDDVAQPE